MFPKKVLCYLPGAARWESLIAGVCARQDAVLLPVPAARVGTDLGTLLGLPGRGLSPAPPVPPSQAALVLFGFSPEERDAFLRELSALGLPKNVLKAVVTPTNLGWSFAALCAELARERDAMTD